MDLIAGLRDIIPLGFSRIIMQNVAKARNNFNYILPVS